MKLTDANRRALKAAAMLVPVVVLTHWFAGASPTAPSGGYARQAIPAELSGADRWLSQGDHELSDRAIQILETNDYLLRGYVAESGAGRVELCIVFAKDSRTSIHPPEVCLKGEGARIADTRRHTVPIRGGPAPGIDAMELAIESNGRLRLYWYTYKVGPTFTASRRSSMLYKRTAKLWNAAFS